MVSMGNLGKRKVPFAARKKAGHPGKSTSNPFEAVKSKQRFNVIGRKSASTKNINKARSDAIDMVRHMLYCVLVEIGPLASCQRTATKFSRHLECAEFYEHARKALSAL